MKYTLQSKIKDVYKNPVGHDVISKILLQLNLPSVLITNPVVSNLTLGQIKALSRKRLSEGFFDTLIDLLSSGDPTPM